MLLRVGAGTPVSGHQAGKPVALEGQHSQLSVTISATLPAVRAVAGGQGLGSMQESQSIGRAEWKGSLLSCPVSFSWARAGQVSEPRGKFILLELFSGEKL